MVNNMTSSRKRVRYDSEDSKVINTNGANLLTPNESSDVETTTPSDPSMSMELSGHALRQLYSIGTVAKIWGVASKALQQVRKMRISYVK